MLDISRVLAADLRELAISLDVSDAAQDALVDAVRTFHRDVSLAVRSFLGLTITLEIYGENASFTILDYETAIDVGTTLRILLETAEFGPSPWKSAILYAERPGAFGDLTADLKLALGLQPSDLVLDGDAVPSHRSDLADLHHLSVINRAIGVLIGRGHTVEEALTELKLLSEPNGSLWSAARHLVAVL